MTRESERRGKGMARRKGRRFQLFMAKMIAPSGFYPDRRKRELKHAEMVLETATRAGEAPLHVLAAHYVEQYAEELAGNTKFAEDLARSALDQVLMIRSKLAESPGWHADARPVLRSVPTTLVPLTRPSYPRCPSSPASGVALALVK